MSIGINRDGQKRLNFCDARYETDDAVCSIYVDQWLFACLNCIPMVAKV